MMRRTLVPGALATLCLIATPARADFDYTMRREIHAVDARSGAEMAFGDQKVGEASRRTLGVTGRVAIAHRMTMVEEGGQVFVHAQMPEALANQPHDLDVLVDGKDGMRVRGSMHFEPGSTRHVARLFVLPEIPPGPARGELRVRGVSVADWQEIVSEEVEVPKKARLRLGHSLEGKTSRANAVELVVEARPVEGDKDANPVVLLSTRMAGNDDDWDE